MYFPYLKWKEFETATFAQAQFLSSGSIIPIFEPVSLSYGTKEKPRVPRQRRWLRNVAENDVRFGLIVNSANGDPVPTLDHVLWEIDILDDLYREYKPDLLLPAFEIRAEQNISELEDFAQRFGDRQCIFVHRNCPFPKGILADTLSRLDRLPVHIFLDHITADFRESLPAIGRVLMRDGFKRRTSSRYYPTESGFHNLLFTYQEHGCDGFSDFSIIGDILPTGWGKPKNIALHLAEKHEDTMVIKHFVSDGTLQESLPSAMYRDALKRLLEYTGIPPSAGFDTQGVHEFRTQLFKRLGQPKQWGIMHHMEIVERELKAQGITPFI